MGVSRLLGDALGALVLGAADDVVRGSLRLDAEVVLATAHQEVAGHAPLVAVGVAHAPELRACLLIDTPTEDDDRVVQVHPCDAVVL